MSSAKIIVLGILWLTRVAFAMPALDTDRFDMNSVREALWAGQRSIERQKFRANSLNAPQCSSFPTPTSYETIRCSEKRSDCLVGHGSEVAPCTDLFDVTSDSKRHVGWVLDQIRSPLVPPHVEPAETSGAHMNGHWVAKMELYPQFAVKNGEEILDAWNHSAAETRSPLCVQNDCWFFTKAEKSEIQAALLEDWKDSYYSLDFKKGYIESETLSISDIILGCPVAKFSEEYEQIGKCVVVSVRLNGMTYIGAVDGYRRIFYSAGLPDMFFKLKKGRADLAAVGDLIMQVLEREPFKLKVAKTVRVPVTSTAGAPPPSPPSSVTIYGHAKFGVSKILPGWCEIVTVQAHAGPAYGQSEEGEYSLVIATTIYISKQKTKRPQDYRLPEDAQQERYLEVLAKMIAKSLGSSVIKDRSQHTY